MIGSVEEGGAVSIIVKNAASPSSAPNPSCCCILQGCGVGISSFSLGRSSTGTSLAEEEATGSDADARPTNVSVTKSNPLEAYIAVGDTIKRCWFNAADPLLPKHVYRADVSPGGGTVKITVHQRARAELRPRHRSICCRRVCREG